MQPHIAQEGATLPTQLQQRASVAKHYYRDLRMNQLLRRDLLISNG